MHPGALGIRIQPRVAFQVINDQCEFAKMSVFRRYHGNVRFALAWT